MMYVGLDVHKSKTTVACLDAETGELRRPYSVATGELDLGRRVLCFVGGSVGRGVGSLAGVSSRALGWVAPRNVLAAVGKVTGVVSGLWCGVQGQDEVKGP